MKYALEFTVKFSADSDSQARVQAQRSIILVRDIIYLVTLRPVELDEIRLIDDDFYQVYGENRFIDIADLFRKGEKDESGDQEGNQEG